MKKEEPQPPTQLAPGSPAAPSKGAWPAVSDLPDPRCDGRCVHCEKKEAVTRDGRFCKKCLHELVVKLTPGSALPGGINRTNEQKAAHSDDPSPWCENNVRILEGD